VARLSSPIEQLKSHYQIVVVGSGYGGGITASRMARAGQEVVCSFQIESLPLNPGPYRLRMWLKSHLESLYWEVPKSFEVNVEETLVYGTRRVERQSHGVAAARTKVRIDTV